MRLTNTENGQQSIISKRIAVTASLALTLLFWGAHGFTHFALTSTVTVRGTGLIALAKAANQNRAA